VYDLACPWRDTSHDGVLAHSFFWLCAGGAIWKFALYAFRAAGLSKLPVQSKKDDNPLPQIPFRPALFGIHQRTEINTLLYELQELGMTTMGLDDHVEKYLFDSLPDMLYVL